MPKLFDIAEDLLALNALLDELDGGELTPEAESAFTEWAKTIEQDEARKMDGYCNIIKMLDGEAAVAKAEAEQYTMRARTRENRVKWLKERMKQYMEAMDRKKIQTATGRTVAIQANGGKAPMTQAIALNPADMTAAEVSRCDERFIKPKVALDMEAVRAALEAGESIELAKLEPRGNHLRIR